MVKSGLAPAAAILVSLTVAITTTKFMGIATAAYSCMVIGYLVRKNRNLHVRLMSLAIFLDIALVLILESQRQAIETAISLKFGLLQQAHIYSSATATVLYFPVLFMGFYLWKNPGVLNVRNWHIRLGKAAFFFRSLGFILMFTLLFQAKN